jgi:hypothetical protein
MLRTSKAKTIAAAIGALATVVAGVFADDVLGVDEVGTLISALVAAAGTVYAVFRVPNRTLPPGR